MDRPHSPQQQAFTARQLAAALGVVVCLAFVVIYSGRIVLEMRARADLANVKSLVEQETARKEQLEQKLAAVDSPEAVDAYARNELNQTKPGDQQIVPLPAALPTLAPATTPTPAAPTAPTNWQLWWELVAPASR